jgi:hypothetical protein
MAIAQNAIIEVIQFIVGLVFCIFAKTEIHHISESLARPRP